jgi:hypothetical protein
MSIAPPITIDFGFMAAAKQRFEHLQDQDFWGLDNRTGVP